MQSDYEKKNKPELSTVVGKPMKLRIDGEEVYCLHYPSKTREKGPIYIDIHGGGFLWAFPEEDDLLCARINDVLDIEIYSLEYPHSPIHMFPEAHESLFRTIAYLCDHANEYNFDPFQVCIGGHSAGGNLALAVNLLNIGMNRFEVKCMVLDYPAVDNRKGAITDDMFRPGDILNRELMEFFTDAYIPEDQTTNPLCNPILIQEEELRQMPPVVLMTCGNDVLRIQGSAMAKRLREADVPIIHFEYPNVTHAFDVFPGPHMKKGQDFLIMGIKYFMELE